MRRVCWLVVACALCPSAVVPAADSAVEVAVLTDQNWDQFVPQGKEVDAIVGDIVLRNAYVTAVIAQPSATRHANMTVQDVAGCLIDLAARDAPSDQLACFYPGRKQFPFRQWSVSGDGESLPWREDLTFRGAAAAVSVASAAADDRPEATVTYALGVHDRVLRITTEFTNRSAQPLAVPLADDLRLDSGKEDVHRTPNGVAERFVIADRYWGQAYGVQAPRRRLQIHSDTRTATLKYLDAQESDALMLEPGRAAQFTRSLAVGSTALHVLEALAHDSGAAATPVLLAVRDGQGRPLEGADLDVSREGQLVGTLRTDPRGEARAPIHPGEYSLAVRFNGAVVREGERLLVPPAVEQQQSILLGGFVPGTVEAEIVDGEGRPVACKVEFLPRGETPRPDFGPVTAEYAVKNLRYAPDGIFTQHLHPGTYDVIVSHGPEYDAVFTSLTVEAGRTARLTARLPRVVDTTGWVSSDFHSHSSPSGDNTSSQLGRVINLLCEHIEFAPCTEHNRISTYQDHIDRLKIGRRLASCSGIELTGKPLPLNHQNAFPLHHHPRRQDGGGPQTADDPQTQIERLALWDDRSEKLIQQNHPDIGWLFYDRDGDGRPDGGFSGAFGFMDVIEIHPIDAAWHFVAARQPTKDWSNRVFHWVQLLNQGYRIPGVVNTDAHYNDHGSGGLRNWLQSPTDEPGEIKVLDMVHAAEHGRLIMSNGPFLKVSARAGEEGEAVTAGGDLAAPHKAVALAIEVLSPNWISVDEVFVLINGTVPPQFYFTRQGRPSHFSQGVRKFSGTFLVELETDAHIIVVAGSPHTTLGPVAGPEWGKQKPTAISNPIFVDVDGNGFQANKDTLGRPLPVKDGTPE